MTRFGAWCEAVPKSVDFGRIDAEPSARADEPSVDTGRTEGDCAKAAEAVRMATQTRTANEEENLFATFTSLSKTRTTLHRFSREGSPCSARWMIKVYRLADDNCHQQEDLFSIVAHFGQC